MAPHALQLGLGNLLVIVNVSSTWVTECDACAIEIVHPRMFFTQRTNHRPNKQLSQQSGPTLPSETLLCTLGKETRDVSYSNAGAQPSTVRTSSTLQRNIFAGRTSPKSQRIEIPMLQLSLGDPLAILGVLGTWGARCNAHARERPHSRMQHIRYRSTMATAVSLW